MIRVAFSFPAGRYHGTPWGRHVNEGAVEWPPSPWRIVRGLIATGYAKLQWDRLPGEAVDLLTALCEHPPSFWLPREVTTGHTRHYMPDGAVAKLDERKDVYNRGTDLVIDAFVCMPQDQLGLVVEWPIVLGDRNAALLANLVRTLSHLGRAEAWVEARLFEEREAIPEHMIRCAPGDESPDAGWERVELLSPLTERAFQDWAATWQASTHDSGKALKSKKKSGNKRVKLPPSLVDALQATTSQLQADGWSQPPGSRWMGYWRHPNAVVERPAKREASARRARGSPTAALLALASDTSKSEVLPRLTEALWQGEAIHDALVSISADDLGRSPASLTGVDDTGRPLTGHRHAHVLPLTLERRDGRIDHVAVVAPMGFDLDALAGLQRLRHTYAKGLPTLYVTVVGLGTVRDIGRRISEFGSAKTWVSRTPFVPPRHLKDKGKDTLVGQVQAECASRGLPLPTNVEVQLGGVGDHVAWLPGERFEELVARLDGRRFKGASPEEALEAGLQLAPTWRHFRRVRRDERKAPPRTLAVGLRISFSELVQGPVALGYGAHFGLGLMRPKKHHGPTAE